LIESEFSAALQEALRKALTEPTLHRRHTAALADVEVLRWFLTHGYLPWYVVDSLTLAELEYHVAEALAGHPELAGPLAELLQQEVPLQRLLRQFSAQMLWRVADALRPGTAIRFRDAWAPWAEAPEEVTKMAFWRTFFENPTGASDILPLKANAAWVIPETEVPVKVPALPGQEVSIFLGNAGLVLLHPFLSTLFNALDMAANGKITAPDQALFALHFAATGETTAPEWALTLPKILCGIPLDQSVWRNATLTETAQNEIVQMLDMAIAHWTAIGNTTVSGLREGFLQRRGRLTEGSETWTLKIEHQSYDMLLDQLPWGISMVKLPWMEKMLYVEWV
jgi:Contractile injection system tape measure protein